MTKKGIIGFQVTISNEYLKTRRDFLRALNRELKWIKHDATELYKNEYE